MAFKDLPEHHSTQQAITRFCQGLADKAVASQVSNKVPATMEETINNAKWCQHVHQAVYGKKTEHTRVTLTNPRWLMCVNCGQHLNSLWPFKTREDCRRRPRSLLYQTRYMKL